MASSPHLSPTSPTRQKRAGEVRRRQSQERLVEAAGEVFLDRGYAGATVGSIAEQAGVSLQTLYTAWGSKRRLLRAYVEYKMTGSATAVSNGTWVPSLQSLHRPEALADAAAQIRSIAKIFCDVSQRMGPVWQLTRDAAGVDPEVAEDHAELEKLRRSSMTGLLTGIDETSLRTGLGFDTAVDTLLVLASPNSYQTLVKEGGYSLDDYEEWLSKTLQAALLRPQE